MASRLIDITSTLISGMTTFPTMWHPYVEITQLGRFQVEGRETRRITLGTHTGTHVDAARHFIPDGVTIEHTNLENFFGDARLLDFSNLADRTEITKSELIEKAGENPPKRIVFRYDWDQRSNSPDFFTNHPYLSEDACKWIVKSGICLVGFDAPMPDNPENGRGADKDSPNHKILLGNGVNILENLCNLKEIPNKDFVLSALPLKIADGDGSPVRAVAIVNE